MIIGLYLRRIFIVIFFCLSIIAPLPSIAADSSTGATNEIRIMDVVRTALEKDATVRIYKSQQTVAAANEQSTKAQFDPQLKASVARSTEYSPISQEQQNIFRRLGAPDVTKSKQSAFSYNVGYEKRYRSGLAISPSITVSTSESNNPSSRVPLTSGKVQFAVIKPLSRGKNSDANTVYEKTSKIESESASLDCLHTISQTARGAILAYWNYAYSYKALKIAQESKARSEKLYNDTKTLVESSEVPPAELDQLQASLNQKLADCEKASQSLLQTKNDLKIAMGITGDSSFEIGPPADFFPTEKIVNGTVEVASLTKKLMDFALANRNDYLAAKKRLESFKFTITAARDSLKPQIDLQIAAGYNGRQDDKGAAAIISALHDNVPGTNVSATVNYSIPIGRRSARADVVKQEEQYMQARIKADEIVRLINFTLETRVNAVSSIINRYKSMIESGRLYDKALQNEREKNRMGVSTLLDVVNLEDRLGQAELSLESAVLEYASAIVNLRYEAGCLGTMTTSECEIKFEDIMALPEVKNLEK